ncbi:MAG: alginate lyase family protein, partial [Candidatus Limnocylindrales bacterium]
MTISRGAMSTGRGQPDEPPAGDGPDGVRDTPSVTPGGSVGDADPVLYGFFEAPPPARRATDLGQRVTPPEPPEPGQLPGSPAVADGDPGGPEDRAGRSPSDETGAEPHHGAGPDAGPRPPSPSRISRAHPFGRRRVLPAAIVVAIAAGVLVAILGSAPGQRPVGSAAGANPIADVGGYLVISSELRKRAGDAARGIAPFADAVDDLQSWATSAVQRTPHPVQPLVVVGNDNVLVDDATRAYGLGLAYVASGDERFAVAAAATIRAWVHDVHWADDTCTDDGGCHTTLSISRAAPGFVFGAGLIADSAAWTAADAAAFRSWLRTVILPAASERPNNWGDAGTFMRVVVADYLGERTAFDTAISKWRSLLDLIEADGRIPEESRRGAAGISYTQEALQYKLAVARIAELRGIDLWDAMGAKGGTLKVALDRLAYFSVHPDEWPDAINPEVPSPGPAWEIAYAHWPEPAWVPFVEAVRPYGDRGHSAIRWTTLTNGIPIDPITAGGSASPSGSSAVGSPVTGESADPSTAPSDPPAVPSLTSIGARLVDTSASGDVRVRVSWSAPA